MHYADYKTILSAQNGVNLYRGCTHGCIYCDSRSRCYSMDHTFEDIEVKRDALSILEAQLAKKRRPCMVGTGSMCDPYIELEEELSITRGCLKLLLKYGFGVSVLSKSTRILRDLDILRAIGDSAKCVVQTTLTTFDESLCREIEPNVSTTLERVEILKAMQREKIPTIVWISPILPFINDTEKNLRGLLGYCRETGVKGILCFGFGVTLREGSREHFYACLDRRFPGMKQKYIGQFGSAYQCDSPHSDRLMSIFRDFCDANGILYKTRDVFAYLRKFDPDGSQLSLF